MASVKSRKTARGTVYDITVSLGRDPSGKQVLKRMVYHPLSKTPRAIAAEVRHAAECYEAKCKNQEQQEKTLSEFYAQHWQQYATGHLTEYQRKLYESILKRIWLPEIGQLQISEITPKRIQEIIDGMDRYQPATIKKILTALRSVLGLASDLGYIPEDPGSKAKVPKKQGTKRLHYWTAEQCAFFLKALTSGMTYKDKTGRTYHIKVPLMWISYFAIAIYGSLRRAEIVALRWEDISMDKGTIHIRRSIMRGYSGCTEKEPKTAAGTRLILLPAACIEILKQYQEHTGKTSGPLFVQRGKNRGKTMDVSSPTKKFQVYLRMINAAVPEAEKLPEITLHDLRHTGATLMIASGVDIETVSHRLGHSRASVTLDVYAEAMRERDIEAAESIDHAFMPDKDIVTKS
ncbi:MAG: site-specific integrase [Oscillospiraceae bacterium]|nr:site-specific integrase [Oscillospiraceae bacterium]